MDLKYELVVIAPESGPLSELDLKGVTVRHIVWSGDTEMTHLRDFDIGLMPLFADQEWDKYKCGLKLIQYMAIGIPAVASPVGVDLFIYTPEEFERLRAGERPFVMHALDGAKLIYEG